ncbi:PREDICTED: protein vestigial [Nicrophorus vespilloides]|uniref:Protein vestigial n=1 Tax=Nicrophorus vespilloides TaxID=110193 RepID=A0ABM1MF35_NICVS|nr:PREDICTED: protein vestigial [Nicrophorus vespilloides]
MSCSEVMYQAYYPYLYQRAGAAPAHPVPRAGPFPSPFGAAHQYDRFNVQRLQESSHPLSQATASSSGAAGLEASSGSGVYATHSTGGSTVGSTPSSPLRPHKEEDGQDDSSEEGAAATPGGSRAQYVSANCVVFTHYQGDAATVVDEHFSRALDKTNAHNKETSPMSARNFPPSFWNSSQYGGGSGGGSGGDLYQGTTSDHYHPGDWYHQYTAASHRAVHDYHHHHHNMAAQYGGLLLPGSRLHMPGAQCKAMDWQHPSLDNPYTSYPTMSGLEAQVQDSSKDLYWF